MSSEPVPEDPSLRLPSGTRVGSWRVVELLGSGAYGLVHRALHVGQEHAGPVALKLARYPWDPRFAREAALLSRIHSPFVPRLRDHGLWRMASGAEHPYLVMEWVDGPPLYSWAQDHAPSSEQWLRLFSELARALAATHAVNAVHRDVKGDNIRVRRGDGRAQLIDFGSGHFQGASRLTWNSLPPGTPAYLSPAAGLFQLRSVGSPNACFEATAADDLYSLGVTAYRLLTGQYPPELEPRKDKAGAWLLVRSDPSPALERNTRLDPLLRQWILRLLSLRAEERGTAEELAEALEGAAVRAGPPAPAEPIPPVTEVLTSKAPLPRRTVRRAPLRRGSPWRALAVIGLCCLGAWALQLVPLPPEGSSAGEQEASSSKVPDAGAAAVGDSSPAAPLASVHPPSEREAIVQQLPPKPRPGQARPDEKGRCPVRKHVVFNGACWLEYPVTSAEACAENGLVYYRGQCYAPAWPQSDKPLPTSNPSDSR